MKSVEQNKSVQYSLRRQSGWVLADYVEKVSFEPVTCHCRKAAS